jgi:hypothetical protein
MENPLAKLPRWGQVAVAAGGIGVVYFAYKNHKSSTASTPASTTSGAMTTAPGTITDPTTGQTYADTALDPITGQTYEMEITDYGSVNEADSIYEQSGNLNGFSYENGTLTGTAYSSTSGSAQTGANYANNAQWSQAAQQGLTEIGYNATDVAAALGDYLNGIPLSSDYVSIVQTALAEYGNPPAGSYSIVQSSGTPTSTSGTIPVPNVVGMSAGNAHNTLVAAGLVPADPNANVAGEPQKTVTATSPAAGADVTAGSKVELIASTASTTTVSVPNVVGKSIDEAGPIIQAAGLKYSGPAPVRGKVVTITSQTPAAGSKVAPGTTVRCLGKTS